MRLALFQPDMPQNTGTMLRLGACVDVEVDIIEPCGFDERALRRYGMDYLELVKYRRHNSWDDFCSYAYGHPEEYGRIILLTTKSPLPYYNFEFRPNDVLLVGRESAGVQFGRRPADHSDDGSRALDQRGGFRHHGFGRGAAADAYVSGKIGNLTKK